MSDIQLTQKQKLKIKEAIQSLNDVRKEVQTKNPDNDINWYLEDCGNFNLMDNQSHDNEGNPRKDRVINSFDLDESSGGGW